MCELPADTPVEVHVAPSGSSTNTVVTTCCQANEARALDLLMRPARSLTVEEAFYVLVYLARRREIAFVDRMGQVRGMRFSPDCVPLFPAIPPAAAPHGPPPLPLVSLHPCVSGVLVVIPGLSHSLTSLVNIDARLAIFVYKLARTTRLRWSATTLLHAGLGGGGPHAERRAFDFVGIRVPRSASSGSPPAGDGAGDASAPPAGSQPSRHAPRHPAPSYLEVQVHRDWGLHRIPDALLPPVPPGHQARTLRFMLSSSGERLDASNLRAVPSRASSLWPVWQNGDYMNVRGRVVEYDDRQEAFAYAEGDATVSDPVIRRPEDESGWAAGRLNAVEGWLHQENSSLRFSGQRYRLTPEAGRIPDPYDVFLTAYTVAAAECSDRSEALYHPRSNHLGPHGTVVTSYEASRLDALDSHGSLILHPDFPSTNPWLPQAHVDHVHAQIGPTSPERSRHRSPSPLVYEPCAER